MAKPIVTNSPDSGNPQPSEAIRLKLSPCGPAIPCSISPAVYGPAYLTIYYHDRRDYIQLLGSPAELADELRRLADVIQPSSVKERHARAVVRDLAKLPAVLDKPETAWPWLVQRFPWLFDGVDVSREPYSSYVKGSKLQADLVLLEPYRGQVLSQADVAQILFDDRTKTGGGYRRRILAGLAFLDGATTAASGAHVDLDLKKVA